ncbi:MAG: hypothetical protein MP439_05545 [Ferrimicrobium sp.]|jgi:hypothetical protein|nr:hypothetical protein [Ferrimicrobium sp.]
MNEDAGESGGSPRERLAQIRTLLNGVFSTSDSERPQAWVDMMHGVLTIPPSAVLSTYEHGLWQAFLSYDPPSANHGDVNDLTALGWLTTTFHQAHASLLLASEGLGGIAVANVRAAMEHAFLLSAFSSTEDSETIFDSITSRHRKELKRLLDFVGGQDVPEGEVVEAIASLIPTGDSQDTETWPQKIKQVCDRLDTGERIYHEYGLLSGRLHPGLFSVLLPAVLDYPKADASTPPDLDASEADSFLIRYDLWIAIGACAWAGWAVDRFFNTHHFEPLLAEFAGELGFVPIFKAGTLP